MKNQRPIVIKLGGRALDGAEAAAAFARSMAALAQPLVIVHGGGAEVSAWAERLGLFPEFLDGLRITDAATLEVAVAVLAGLANKRLVAALRAASLDAVGFAALDGGIADVVPHQRAARLGAVGEVRAIHPQWLCELLDTGRVPVLASIGAHQGTLLNVNADDLAAAVASAIGASKLVLFSDVTGVGHGGGVRREMSAADAERAIESGEATGGMIAKLRAAQAALVGGVTEVHITQWSGPETVPALLNGISPGTRLTAAASDHRALAGAAAAPGVSMRGEFPS